jgi:hypothetical protein
MFSKFSQYANPIINKSVSGTFARIIVAVSVIELDAEADGQ